MFNQMVNLTPQQRMAQMLQQQSQPTEVQGQQAMPQSMGQAAQSPFSSIPDAMKMYSQFSQSNDAQDVKDYIARLRFGQAQKGGIFDSANAQAPNMTANNYTG
jgi:hypothetical protein